MALGAVLMLSALLLFVHNERESHTAGQAAESLLGEVRDAAEEAAEELPVEKTESAPEEPLDAEMPAVLIDGDAYIGYVSIPALELELPVLADWDYSRLKVAPGRHFGSSRMDDLVIAAHNYETHFGALSTLETGDEVLFTDMDGIKNRYTLTSLETVAADAVSAVRDSGHDLVLYTCTTGGAERVAAFCDRVQTEEGK